jgi:hypothetical protein
MAAAAQKFDMFLCVQDLTCPGQSFLQSAGLAAHIGPVTAIEGMRGSTAPAQHGVGGEVPGRLHDPRRPHRHVGAGRRGLDDSDEKSQPQRHGDPQKVFFYKNCNRI